MPILFHVIIFLRTLLYISNMIIIRWFEYFIFILIILNTLVLAMKVLVLNVFTKTISIIITITIIRHPKVSKLPIILRWPFYDPYFNTYILIHIPYITPPYTINDRTNSTPINPTCMRTSSTIWTCSSQEFSLSSLSSSWWLSKSRWGKREVKVMIMMVMLKKRIMRMMMMI